MKKMLLFAISGVLIISAVAFKCSEKEVKMDDNKSISVGQFEPVAVIELFTSQGCSSCPPADHLLAQTINEAKKKGTKIFALSFHVDYWNRLGWADPFSTKEYSERQSEYASQMQHGSVYTPQMVVNGSTEFVGSDGSRLQKALSASLNTKTEAGFKTLTATLQNNEAPKVKFSLEGDYKGCKINFALVALSETTSIKRGENGGITLTNENVVRQFISKTAMPDGEINFSEKPLPVNGNVAIIAYLQRSSDMKIIGASMATLL
ncbi:MAG: DUF1223 domain-containing protein [Ferruginibacter sp.]